MAGDSGGFVRDGQPGELVGFVGFRLNSVSI